MSDSATQLVGVKGSSRRFGLGSLDSQSAARARTGFDRPSVI
jgi:hypothetical protein